MRSAWRPGHFHFIIKAEGYATIVTEVFGTDDPYIDRDAVFGVRTSLTVPYVKHDCAAAAAPYAKGAVLLGRLRFPFARGMSGIGLIPGAPGLS